MRSAEETVFREEAGPDQREFDAWNLIVEEFARSLKPCKYCGQSARGSVFWPVYNIDGEELRGRIMILCDTEKPCGHVSCKVVELGEDTGERIRAALPGLKWRWENMYT